MYIKLLRNMGANKISCLVCTLRYNISYTITDPEHVLYILDEKVFDIHHINVLFLKDILVQYIHKYTAP